MLENPLYIGDRIIDYADLQQDMHSNSENRYDLPPFQHAGELEDLMQYMQTAGNEAFLEHLQNEYGVDMTRPLQYQKFDRPVAVNPYNQEWGYVRLMQFSEYDNAPDYVELIIENPVSSCDERIWQRGEFLILWEGLVHDERL